MKFCYIVSVVPFLIDPKDLDLFYKMDLDIWDYFGRKKKTLSYNGRNTELIWNSSKLGKQTGSLISCPSFAKMELK